MGKQEAANLKGALSPSMTEDGSGTENERCVRKKRNKDEDRDSAPAGGKTAKTRKKKIVR